MKRILFTALAVAFISGSAHALYLVPKFVADYHTNVYWSNGLKEENRAGLGIGLDLRGEFSKYFGWGLGAQYNFPRGWVHKDGKNTKFSMSPIYASLFFYPLETFLDVHPYLRGNIGYSVLSTNQLGDSVKGGLYYGGGLGFEYRKVIFEFIAASYKQKFDYIGPPAQNSIEAEYKTFSFYFGYRFSL